MNQLPQETRRKILYTEDGRNDKPILSGLNSYEIIGQKFTNRDPPW